MAGLDDGCYYYAPQAQELRQIRFKNFRRELHFLCLGQDLGRDAAMVLFHTADLQGLLLAGAIAPIVIYIWMRVILGNV